MLGKGSSLGKDIFVRIHCPLPLYYARCHRPIAMIPPLLCFPKKIMARKSVNCTPTYIYPELAHAHVTAINMPQIYNNKVSGDKLEWPEPQTL